MKNHYMLKTIRDCIINIKINICSRLTAQNSQVLNVGIHDYSPVESKTIKIVLCTILYINVFSPKIEQTKSKQTKLKLQNSLTYRSRLC